MTSNKVIIITGKKGEGKTTKLLRIIELLKKENIIVTGFTARSEWNNGKRNEYKLVDIQSGESISLCISIPIESYIQYGSFYFNPEAISYGKSLLETSINKKSVIIIDEIGPFELNNKIWHNSLINQLEKTKNTLLLTVRDKLVTAIIKKYNLKNVAIYPINEITQTIVKDITYSI